MKRFNGRVSAKVSLGRVNTTRGLSYKGNSLRKIAMQSMFALAFVFLFAGAWAQAKVSYSDAESPVLEVRGVEDASVNVIPVERTSPNGNQLYCAYDIDIIKDGREWQPEPEKPAMVTMENPDFADGQLLDIYHEGTNGLEFVATVAANDGKITFPAHSFSVYIVTQAGDYARLKVNFYKADGESVTIYVKKQDLNDGYGFNRIVYNPGMGADDLPTGVKCMGWVARADENYTDADIRNNLSFEGVRDSIRNRLTAGVTDGTELNFYVMLFKSYSIFYLGENGSVYDSDELFYRTNLDNPQINYTVLAHYTPGDNTYKFEGWNYKSDELGVNNIYRHDNDKRNYPNDTIIKVTGDVVFDVNVTKGHWLIYHENGKGATYKAPEFIHARSRTVQPADSLMKRKGYTFAGWYYGEPTTQYGDPTGDAFEFGDTLAAHTHIYAKWEKNRNAPYTVILWTQNLERTGYEVAASYVNENGNVGDNISYTFVDNGDEDYVTGVGDGNGHYTGFCLKESSKNQEVIVTPEGDAVLNLYYDRITYNFKFYLYRDGTPTTTTTTTPTGEYTYTVYNGHDNNPPKYGIVDGEYVIVYYRDKKPKGWRIGSIDGAAYNNTVYNREPVTITTTTTTYAYDYAKNSSNGETYYGQTNENSNNTSLVTWYVNQPEHPDVTSESGYTVQCEEVSGKKYYYFIIQAYYGEDISTKWPTYDEITGANGREAVSYVMMVGTKLKPDPTNQGSGTVKGIVSVMNENILGATNDANGNYVVVRFPGGTVYNWRYHIWFETVEGEDYTGKPTKLYNGKTYYEETVIVCRSSNTEVDNQNAPKYSGFDFIEKRNDGWNNGNYWTTTEGGKTIYHLNFVYDRQQYKISYFDGNYVNGGNSTIQNRATHLLHESEEIGQGKVIADEFIDYVPSLPEQGYVFEGWYIDEGCTAPYSWTSMKVGGIVVYAKWRQIQYRLFLHPNAVFSNNDVDTTLSWGSDDQAMCFRIDWGGHASLPSGTREDYEFVGWYTNPDCTNPFNENTIVLNETTVTTPYNKTTDFTDYMDKWGRIRTDTLPPYNSDAVGNNGGDRFWITKRYDIYGKWRAKLPGAEGITVVYDGNGGGIATDTAYYLYQDNVNAIAPDACTPPDDTKEFSHWVMQYFAANVDSTYKDIPGSCVFPGDLFPVLRDNSKRVVTEWHNPDDIEDIYGGHVNPNSIDVPADAGLHTKFRATYTIHLRAEYVDKETAPEQTSILWLMNDDTGAEVRNDTDLQINKDVTTVSSIPAAPTREGYTFKGWQKYIADSGELPTTIDVDDCTPDFLYYNSEDGKYYMELAHTNEATKVAADLYNSSDYMYAVWAPDMKFSIYPICKGAQITLPSETFVGESLTGTWDATVGTISGTTYTADPNAESVTLTFTPSGSSACVHEQDTTVAVQTINIDVTDYDYIWKGGAASADDWNTASNWYVYNRANGSYSVADAVPAQAKNIYIGDYNCKANLTPSVGVDDAYANNITIAPDATLTVPDGKTLNISGNFLIEGSFVPSGTVKFVGENVTDTVTVTCADTLKFNNVVFEKDGNEDILVYNSDKGIKVNGKATFTKGIVRNDVVFDAGATANVSNHNSFVAGKVTKIATSEESNFTFPTGSATVGQPKVLGSVTVSRIPANSETTITFHQKSNGGGFSESEMPRWWNAADNCSENENRFDHVSNFEYWKVDTRSDLVATITVSAENQNAHFNPNSPQYNGGDIYGAIWQGGCWKNVSDTHGSVTNSNTTISVGVNIPAMISRAGEGQFLTMGSTTKETLLPIELYSFTATCEGRSALVEWTTATERNNDYFVIERSDDAINFTEIARVAGAGNSIEPLNYTYSDYGINAGDNYYRLWQVDYDGTRTASEIIVVNCVEPELDAPEVQAYPNPFSGELTLELDNFGDRVTSIEVYDMLGRLVYVEQADAPQNRYETILNLSNLSKGAYNIRVSTTDFVINKNVVKN